MKTADPKARRRETLGNDSADDGHVDLLAPFGNEDRLAVRPAGRGRRGLADRLKQGPAAIGMEVRQGGGRAEGAGQPRPNAGADQPLVKETEGSEAGKAVLAEIEGGHRDERRHQCLHGVEAGIVGDEGADMGEAGVEALLVEDAGGLGRIARPALDCVAAPEADVERAADVALGAFTEPRELPHLCHRRRPVGGPRPPPRPHPPPLLSPPGEPPPATTKKAVNQSPAPRSELNQSSNPPAIAKLPGQNTAARHCRPSATAAPPFWRKCVIL